MWFLYSEYGASFRSQIVNAFDPDTYKEDVVLEIAKLAPHELTRLLRSDPPTETSHYLVSTGPSPHDRTEPMSEVASPLLLELYCTLRLNDEAEELRKFYKMLHSDPTTTAVAGKVFEIQAHRFLRKGITLNLFRILSHRTSQGKNYIYDDYAATNNQVVSEQYTLPKLEESIVTVETKTTDKFNTYCCHHSSNFPSIDSWVLVERSPKPPILLAFQITVARGSHDAKKVGLERLDKLAPAGIRKHLIVFTPEKATPQIFVTTDYLTTARLNGEDADTAFPVSHCPVVSDKVFVN